MSIRAAHPHQEFPGVPPGYPYQRDLKEDNGTAQALYEPSVANTAFRAKSRVRLPWLIKCLLCGLDCAMIRRLYGSFLMTGENSLENTLRPPYIFSLSPSLTNACITRGSVFKPDSLSFLPTFRHTRCRNQHYYLSNSHYSAILCLVWDLLHSHRTGSRKYPLLCNISFTLANKK